VLFGRDGALLAEGDLGPVLLWDQRPGQPTHVQSEVVDTAKEDVGRNRADLHHLQQVLGTGFEQGQVPDEVECLVLQHPLPTVARRALLGLSDFLEGNAPGALDGSGV